MRIVQVVVGEGMLPGAWSDPDRLERQIVSNLWPVHLLDHPVHSVQCPGYCLIYLHVRLQVIHDGKVLLSVKAS